MEIQRVKVIHANTRTGIVKVAMMVAIATKSRHLALLCELDISDCLLACTVIFIPVSLLHYSTFYTKPGVKVIKLQPSLAQPAGQ
jgi:hypothetical protein